MLFFGSSKEITNHCGPNRKWRIMFLGI